MKRILIAAAIAFAAFSTSASTGNNPAGSTQMGPMKNCTLPSGEIKYIPVGMCRHLGGQY